MSFIYNHTSPRHCTQLHVVSFIERQKKESKPHGFIKVVMKDMLLEMGREIIERPILKKRFQVTKSSKEKKNKQTKRANNPILPTLMEALF